MATFRVTHEGASFGVTVDDTFLSLPQEQQAAELAQAFDSYRAARPRPAASGTTPSAEPQTTWDGALRQSGRNLTTGLGATARVVGNAVGSDTLRSMGESLSGAVPADPTYRPASPEVTEGIRNLDAGRVLRNIGPAALEQAGGLAATLTGGAIGTAVGGPVGGLAGAAAASGAQSFGSNVEARAANNGRTEPETSDLAMGGLTTVGSAAMDAIGARGVGGAARSVIDAPRGLVAQTGNVARVVGREGVTEAAQTGVEQVGQTIGTDRGLTIDPAEIAAGGLIGAAARAGTAAPGATLRGATQSLVSAGANAAAGDLSTAEAASVERVNRLLSERIAQTQEVSGRTPALDEVVNSTHEELSRDIARQLRQLRDDGWVDREEYGRLAGVLETAQRRNKSLATSDPDAADHDYRTGLAAVEEILGRLPAGFRTNVDSLLRDLNTLSQSARRGSATGPFERLGGVGGRLAAVGMGAATGGPAGALAGAALSLGGNPIAARAGATIGRGIDRAAGIQVPPAVLARAKALRVLRDAGLTGEDVGNVRLLLAENRSTLESPEALRRAALGLAVRKAETPEQREDRLEKLSADAGDVLRLTRQAQARQTAREVDAMWKARQATLRGADRRAKQEDAAWALRDASQASPTETVLRSARARAASPGRKSPDAGQAFGSPRQKPEIGDDPSADVVETGPMRGWQRYVQVAIGSKGYPATRADIAGAAQSLVDDGQLEQDEADAMMAANADLPGRLMDPIIGRIAKRQGWSFADAPDTGGQSAGTYYAGIHSPRRYDAAAENYQTTARTNAEKAEKAGDWPLAELLWTFATASTTDLPGAQRIYLAKALIAGGADHTQRARRAAYLNPLLVRFASDRAE